MRHWRRRVWTLVWVLVPSLLLAWPGTVPLRAESIPASRQMRDPASPQVVPGVVLVRPRAGIKAGDVLRSDMPAEEMEGAPFVRVRVPPGQEESEARQLALDARLEYAEPDYIRTLQAEPNDECYRNQAQWYLRKIRAPEAWNTSKGAGVIAVVDTGADLAHPDLQGKLVQGHNFIDPSAAPWDDHWHGTFVTGIIAAATDNGLHIAGLAWYAGVMPIKVIGADGQGVDSVVAQGVRYAVDNGASIINLSLAGSAYSQTLKDAIDYAWSRDRLVVAAAGNSGDSGNPVMYPAAFDHVMAVAATDINDQHAPYSEVGPYISVSAPGGYVPPGREQDTDSNLRVASIVPRVQDVYASCAGAEGTSAAAPQVAGLAALIWAANPVLHNQDVRDVIEHSAHDIAPAGKDDAFGWGRIDAAAALALAMTPALRVDQTSLWFMGDPAIQPKPLAIAIANDGYGFLNWTASANATPNWLRVNGVTSTSGTVPHGAGPVQLQVAIDRGGLTTGRTYNGQIVISAPGTSSKGVSVTLYYPQKETRLLLPNVIRPGR